MPMSMSYNESVMESWFHRFRGVNVFRGFIRFVVSTFHGFIGFVVSIASWFHRFLGVKGFIVS